MVSTNYGITNNSPMDVEKSVNLKNPSASNSLSQILEPLNLKQKTAIHILISAKIKRKTISTESDL